MFAFLAETSSLPINVALRSTTQLWTILGMLLLKFGFIMQLLVFLNKAPLLMAQKEGVLKCW